MDFTWLNQTIIIQAGGIVTALSCLGVLVIIFRGYREQGKQFTKILGNHLHDAHLDKREEIKSRNKNTEALTRLCEKIDNLG